MKGGIALLIALLFVLLSIFPTLGYQGEAKINDLYRNWQLLYMEVDISANITYNPFLFSLSWLTGNGIVSTRFMMRAPPKSAVQGMVSWASLQEVEEDALIMLMLNTVFLNLPYNFIIVLAIELLEKRILYLCLFGGMIGFILGGLVGSLVCFIGGVFVVGIVMPRLRRSKDFTEVIKTIRNWRQP